MITPVDRLQIVAFPVAAEIREASIQNGTSLTSSSPPRRRHG
jgi:hypothetical protein